MKPIVNAPARASYEFLEDWEAGIILSGAEVKSVKAGKVNLRSAYIGIEKNALWLRNCLISTYQAKNQPDYDPERPRKILLHKEEIARIIGKIQREGLTVIPEKMYSKCGLIKVRIVLARGLKKHDKREKIKKRDIERDVRRVMKYGE